MDNSLIRRQAAIDAAKRNTFRLTLAEEQNGEGHVVWSAEAVYSDVMENELLELPPAQPDWGKPVGNGRPLADCEIIPRLQDIKAQIGGSYAIERTIEVLEGLQDAQPNTIPVDWIQKYADDWEDMNYAYDNPILGMLEDWRREQDE